MAIDTRTKRQNAAQVGCPLPVSVLPSGTIDVAVRYQIGWSYGGNETPPPVGGADYLDRTAVGSPWGPLEPSGAHVGV